MLDFRPLKVLVDLFIKLSRLLTNDKTPLMVCSKTHLMTAHSKERSFERPSNANVTVVDFKTVTVAGGAFLHNATNSATAMAGKNKAVREAVARYSFHIILLTSRWCKFNLSFKSNYLH